MEGFDLAFKKSEYLSNQSTVKCVQETSVPGLSILFAGDFNQLGPVKRTFLPKDMMIWATRINSFSSIPTPKEPELEPDSYEKSQKTNRELLEERKMKITEKKNKKEMEVNRFKPSSIAY